MKKQLNKQINENEYTLLILFNTYLLILVVLQ